MADSFNLASYVRVSLQQLGHVITVNVGNRNISPCPHPLVNYFVRLTFCAFLWLTSLTFPLIKHHNCNYCWVFASLPTPSVTVDGELNKCTYHHHNGQTFGPPQKLFISARPWCNSSSKCLIF